MTKLPECHVFFYINVTGLSDEVQLLAGIHQHIITQEPGSDLLTIRQNVSRTLAPEDNGQKLVCRAEHEALDAPKEVARQLVVHCKYNFAAPRKGVPPCKGSSLKYFRFLGQRLFAFPG